MARNSIDSDDNLGYYIVRISTSVDWVEMKLLMFVRYETLGDTLVTPDKHHTTAAQHDSDHTAAPGLIH